MRVVEHKMCNALKSNKNMTSGNTEVRDGRVYLHGNMIAELSNGILFISDCNWQTNTTKSRLNALLSAFNVPYRISSKKWKWYIGEDRWLGSTVMEVCSE